MNKLNLVMIAKNEEFKIKRCILSVKELVDDIIIVDTGSTDNTKEIAKKLGAIVYDYMWDNNFSNARNYGLEKSNAEWNLILDADEYITEFNIESINRFISKTNNAIGQINIVNLFEQDEEIKKSSFYLSRLAPKGTYFEGAIHEQLDANMPREIVEIKVEHDGYLNTNKFDRNITLILKELGKNSNDVYMNYQAAKTYYNNKNYAEAQRHFEKFYNTFDINNDIFAKEGIVLYLYNIIQMKEFEKGLNVISETFDILSDYSDFYFVVGLFFTELVSYDTQRYIGYFENIELSYLSALEIGENNKSVESVEGTGSYLAAFNLGVFYELKGDKENAIKYYRISSDYGYGKANDRLNNIFL